MKSSRKNSRPAAGKKMNPVVHFEIPAKDRKRISRFYTKAFGWKTQMLNEENGNYVLATTASQVDKTGTPRRGGIINGGFYMRDSSKPAQYPSIVIAVDDIENSMQEIKRAGGKMLGKHMEIPGYGMYVSFFDTEGNRVSIMEPFMG